MGGTTTNERDSAVTLGSPSGVTGESSGSPAAGAQAIGQATDDESASLPRAEGLHRDTDGSHAVNRSSSKWWMSVAIALILVMPLAWVLSYAATLPFMLGPFFFALFGLVFGAVMHRIASPGRPYNSRVLVVGTTIVVLLIWCISITFESRDFPSEMAAQATTRTQPLGDRTVTEFQADVAEDVRQFLRDKYPPGGPIGYIRWIVGDGEIASGELEGIARTLKPLQSGASWTVRVVLSVALLAFGIASQTMALRLRYDPIIREIDAKKREQS